MSTVNTWVSQELQSFDAGDKRLLHRYEKVLSTVSAFPDKSIPSACNGWSETLAAYRFIDNPKVHPSKILSPHKHSTIERIKNESIVLIAQDTTEIDLTHRKDVDGAGFLSTESSKGFYIHPSIAFTPNGCCLGTVDLNLWVRKKLGVRDERKQKPITEKETYCWLKGYNVANEVAHQAPQTTVINVSDRGGDIYEVLAKQREQENKAYWLIRCNQNRNLLNPPNEKTRKLKDWISAQDVLGHIEFDVTDAWVNRNTKARHKRTARRVVQEVRFGKTTIAPPKRRNEISTTVDVYIVHCKEIQPPENEQPVEWYLITSYPLQSIEDAKNAIHWYLCRWQIEVFFKVLKTGCKVEELQFDTLRRTANSLALYMIVAWRVLYVMMMERNCPNISCEVVFETAEWQAIYATMDKKKPPEVAPTLTEMMERITALGGFLARKSDGCPGPKAIWQGMQRMRDFVIAWNAFQKIANPWPD